MKTKALRMLLALSIVLLLLVPFSGGAVFAEPTGESGLHPVVPYHELPDDIKQILHEYTSPPALQSIRSGRAPTVDLVQAGVRRESFVGDIVAVYHEFGSVYIFRGSGQIVFPDGGEHIVEAPGDAIVVLEAWRTEKLESKMGRRQPPKAPHAAPSVDHRIYAGIDTRRKPYPPHDPNTFFGASAEVRFPQAVTADFNVYTTHVIFAGERRWFESAVGQYAWWGGVANRPNAIAWVNPHLLQWVWQMGLTPASSYKRARISTAHEVTPQEVARMWITDLDLGLRYQRHEWFSGTRTGVKLVQEQRTLHPVVTPWAYFRRTLILLTGDSATWKYEEWTPESGEAGVLDDPGMQIDMKVPATYDFDSRGEG